MPTRESGAIAATDYTFYRQRYLYLQRTMETRIGELRARLRTALAAREGGATGLAALDAIMERSLGARERSLLGAIPGLLERRFAHLRQAAEDAAESKVTAQAEAERTETSEKSES